MNDALVVADQDNRVHRILMADHAWEIINKEMIENKLK